MRLDNATAVKAGSDDVAAVYVGAEQVWPTGPAPLSQGINFRATSGYVSDPAGTVYETGTTANYPHTVGTVTAGWENAPAGTRDRSSSVDGRLAGIHFRAYAGSDIVYRVDVPAGTYNVRLAMGDQGSLQNGTSIAIIDGTTTRATVTGNMAAGAFKDATGTTHASAAAWVSSNTALSVVVSSGILRFKLLAPSSGSSTVLSHVHVSN